MYLQKYSFKYDLEVISYHKNCWGLLVERFMCKDIWVKCHPFYSVWAHGQTTLQLWDLAFTSVKWGLPDLQGMLKLYEQPCYCPIDGVRHQLYAFPNLLTYSASTLSVPFNHSSSDEFIPHEGLKNSDGFLLHFIFQISLKKQKS